MSKKKNINILKFPSSVTQVERQVEAILFAAEEPLTIEDIQERVKTRSNILKILESLVEQYKPRGINLVSTGNKWCYWGIMAKPKEG